MKSSLYLVLAFLALFAKTCAGFSSPHPIIAKRQTLKLASHVIGQEESQFMQEPMQSVEHREASEERELAHTPVDIALLGGMACLTAVATIAWIATDGPLIQNIEDDGSAATLIVDGVFGAVATIVSFVSGED